MQEKVVAHFRNGKTQRGYTHDFKPDVDNFHLLPSEGGGIPTPIRLDELKALFYVKDYGSMRRQVDRAKRFGAGGNQGQRTIVEFRDGEKIWGFTEEYSANSLGFYFVPADAQENNMRIFIVNSSVKQINFEE
ncbi:MAG: hypothetical protein O7A63_02575 [Acidobacteria bacterium]|nr:hypothetical protein [Acidobacteriota bacterium]